MISWFINLVSMRFRNLICNTALFFIIAFHFAQPLMPISKRYPHLMEVINISFSFGVFAFMTIYAVAKMTEK